MSQCIFFKKRRKMYEIELEQTKLFGKTYKANKTITADGIKHSVSFSEIEKSTYNVNIGSPDSQEMHSYGASIYGKGELFQ